MNRSFATLIFLLVAIMAGWQLAMATPEALPAAKPEALPEDDMDSMIYSYDAYTAKVAKRTRNKGISAMSGKKENKTESHRKY
ncbi:hypothetical protein KPH14_001316 [Odynerus spinipes]|uniref:Uncharacterized protein n=1 Tax=Odynerus spinipes TaxID=1348599 RepID=A0AAD9RG73_9HYME|nr:hypothetical protein KPH14_001316 [Odynerus spinipes]